MDISWLAEPQTWIGFATLLILEVVLGDRQLGFCRDFSQQSQTVIARQSTAHRFGVGSDYSHHMLASVAKIMTLTSPLMQLFGMAISGQKT